MFRRLESSAKLRMLVDNVESADAYRKLADHLRATVIGLAQPAAPSQADDQARRQIIRKNPPPWPRTDKARSSTSRAHKRA